MLHSRQLAERDAHKSATKETCQCCQSSSASAAHPLCWVAPPASQLHTNAAGALTRCARCDGSPSGTNSWFWCRCAGPQGESDASHLDDIGTKVRQQGAAEIASNHLTNIKDLHSPQKKLPHSCSEK